MGIHESRLLWRIQCHLANAREIITNKRGERRSVVRDYAFRARRRLPGDIEISSGEARFVLNPDDWVVSRTLFVHGQYDRALMTDLHALLSKLRGERFTLHDQLFLDIGANLGSATVEACVHFGAAGAVAFEPEPLNFSFLERNLAANNIGARVSGHRLALSDAAGQLDFELSAENAGDHRVRVGQARENELGEDSREVVTVAAVTLDSLCESGEVDLERVGLAWIDVQGHEQNVLAGAQRLTASDIPIVVEYWPYGLRRHDALAGLHALIAERYTHVLDCGLAGQDVERGLLEVSRIGELAERYQGTLESTDLLLLRLPR